MATPSVVLRCVAWFFGFGVWEAYASGWSCYPSIHPSLHPACCTCVIRSVSWICRHMVSSSSSSSSFPRQPVKAAKGAPTFSFKGWHLVIRSPRGQDLSVCPIDVFVKVGAPSPVTPSQSHCVSPKPRPRLGSSSSSSSLAWLCPAQ